MRWRLDPTEVVRRGLEALALLAPRTVRHTGETPRGGESYNARLASGEEHRVEVEQILGAGKDKLWNITSIFGTAFPHSASLGFGEDEFRGSTWFGDRVEVRVRYGQTIEVAGSSRASSEDGTFSLKFSEVIPEPVTTGHWEIVTYHDDGRIRDVTAGSLPPGPFFGQ